MSGDNSRRADAGFLAGFDIIGFIIARGYFAGCLRILEPSTCFVAHRIKFFVFSPFLLSCCSSRPNRRRSRCSPRLIALPLVATLIASVVYLTAARFVWHRGMPEIVVGALSAGHVDAHNIGISAAV